MIEAKLIQDEVRKMPNMVHFQSVLERIWRYYAALFAKTERKFDRNTETQDEFLNAVAQKYEKEIKQGQAVAFEAIPKKFHKTLMYKELCASRESENAKSAQTESTDQQER